MFSKKLFLPLLNGIVLVIALTGLCSLIALHQLYSNYFWVLPKPTMFPLQFFIGFCSFTSLVSTVYSFITWSTMNTNITTSQVSINSRKIHYSKINAEVDTTQQDSRILFLSSLWLALGATAACFVYSSYQMISLDGIFEKGVAQAMELYGTNMEDKITMDRIQMGFRCCGKSSYKDWLQLNWLPVRKYSAAEKRLGLNFDGGIPFSCCDPRAMRPCIHHNVDTNNDAINYKSSEKTIYEVGCNDVLKSYYKNNLLLILSIVSFQAILQAAVLIINFIK